jgi:hypothetical protein
MTSYAIFAEGGHELARVASLEEAAIEMLTYDGHRFEIRQVRGDYRLYVSRRSMGAHGSAGKLLEWPNYSAKTKDGVYRRVVYNGGVDGTYAEEWT